MAGRSVTFNDTRLHATHSLHLAHRSSASAHRRAATPGARTTLSEPETVSAATTVGAAPMFAVSPAGKRAVAWVSAPGGGTDGRLYVATGGAPSELRDSLGPIEPHGEAPPKIAYAPDGALYALYAVAKSCRGGVSR